MQSHVDHCPLCDGPCREPFPLPPSTDPRPFAEVTPMPQQQQPADAPIEPAPEQPVVEQKPSGKRSRRLQEDRMRRPSEDR